MLMSDYLVYLVAVTGQLTGEFDVFFSNFGQMHHEIGLRRR